MNGFIPWFIVGFVSPFLAIALIFAIISAFSRNIGSGGCHVCDHYPNKEIGEQFWITYWLRAKWHSIFWAKRRWHVIAWDKHPANWRRWNNNPTHEKTEGWQDKAWELSE